MMPPVLDNLIQPGIEFNLYAFCLEGMNLDTFKVQVKKVLNKEIHVSR